MKKLNIFIFITIFFVFSFKQVLSNDKIFFVDLEYLVNNTNIGKKMLMNINNLNEENLSILKNKEMELRTLENEIKNKQNVIDEVQFKKEIDSFKIKAKKFNDEKKIIVSNFNKYKKDKINDLFDTINPIIQKYMDDNSIEILIDAKYVFMGKNSSDITKIMLEEINKKIN